MDRHICFQSREIKAHKMHASQATSSGRLARLQAVLAELAYPLELAKAVFAYEMIRKDCAAGSQQVWETQLADVDLKQSSPSLSDYSYCNQVESARTRCTLLASRLWYIPRNILLLSVSTSILVSHPKRMPTIKGKIYFKVSQILSLW